MANYKDFETITGWNQVDGYRGVNCRHSAGNHIPGVSPPPPTEEELEEQRQRDIATKHYKWRDLRGVEHERDFTYRDALDYQNNRHVQMRATRKLLKAYQSAGQEEAYNEQLARYRTQVKEYKAFSSAMEIDERLQNVTMDGLGRMMSWRSEWNLPNAL